MKTFPARCGALSLAATALLLLHQVAFASPVESPDAYFAPDGLKITSADYPRAETARQFLIAQQRGGVNTFAHNRKLAPTDDQPVVRMNRDTYYSLALVDVSQGATVTMPEVPDGKYLSVQPVTQDHRIQPMHYGGGTFDVTTHTGTHVYLIVRLDSTFSPADAARYQDQMRVSAKSGKRFAAEPVNEEAFRDIENDLKARIGAIAKRDGVNALRGMFTAPTDDSKRYFTQEKYEVGAAVGWGGAQWKDNIYEISGDYPVGACYQATFEDPRNGAFWSFTVYDKAGFMFNDLANMSSDTATPNADGTYTVSFGCGDDAPNNLPIRNPSGVFNVAVRHYEPSERVRDEGYRLVPLIKPASSP